MPGAIRFSQQYGNEFNADYAFPRVQVPTTDVLNAAAQEAILDTPELAVSRMFELYRAKQGVFDEDKYGDVDRVRLAQPIEREDFQKEFGDLGLAYEEGMNRGTAEILAERKRRELSHAYLASHGSGGAWETVGQFGAGMVATMLSPTEIGLSMLPIVGAARFARLAARFSRPGARLLAGGAEGLVGGALTEPFALAARTQEQADYDAWDSLRNVAFGAGLGATLRVGGGAVADLVVGRRLRTHQEALSTAVDQLMDDRHVEVDPILGSDADHQSTLYSEVGLVDETAGEADGKPVSDVQKTDVGEPGLSQTKQYEDVRAFDEDGVFEWDPGTDINNLNVDPRYDADFADLSLAAMDVGMTIDQFKALENPLANEKLLNWLVERNYKTYLGQPLPAPGHLAPAIKNELPGVTQNLADGVEFTPDERISDGNVEVFDPPLFEADFTKIGDQLGSNPGGVHVDKSGTKWYIKQTAAKAVSAVVKNEFLANRFYGQLGLPVFDQKLVVDAEGHIKGIGSRWQDGLVAVSKPELRANEQFMRGFAVDAWLANWDVVAPGNTARAVDGTILRTDLGGSLAFRAQGEPKGDKFGHAMVEFDTMRKDAKLEASKVFGGMADDDPRLLAGVEDVLSVSHSRIRALLNEAGAKGDAAHDLFSKLVARQQWLANRYAKTHPDLVKRASATAQRHNELFSAKSAEQFINEQVKSLIKVLKPADKEALKFWQSGEYDALNRYLFNKVVKDLPINQKYEDAADALDTALMKHSLSSSQLMFRSANSAELFGSKWTSLAQVQELIKRRATRSFAGFTATTFNYNMAANWKPGSNDVLIRAIVPAGHPGIFVGAASGALKHEAEFVLPRKTRMRLISVLPLEGSGKKWEAIVEVLPYMKEEPKPVTKGDLDAYLKKQAAEKLSLHDDVKLDDELEAASTAQAKIDLADAEKALSEVQEELAAIKQNLSETELEGLTAHDEAVKMAEAQGKGAMAAALCMKGKL